MKCKDVKFLSAGCFSGRANVPMHNHDGLELVLVTIGECDTAINTEVLTGGVDTLFILPAKVKHNQINRGFVKTHYIIFQSADSFFLKLPRTISIEGDFLTSRWFNDVLELHNSTENNTTAQIENILGAITERLKQFENNSESKKKMHPALAKAIKIIEANVAGKISIPDLASSCAISQSRLDALFRRHLKLSPLRHLQNLKMQYARKLLSEPYLNIKEVCAMCGYDDVNYFCRIFKKYNGGSPGRFRSNRKP
jgi:AraC-like DNA-binding protein